MTSTIGQNSAHSARPMYDPELRRTPRDLATTQQVLDLCTVASSRAAAVRMCQPIGMWPERSALLDIPLFNMHLQTRGDRLHVFDGGISQRLLLYVGNWVFDKAGPAGLSVLNARIAALPPCQEFKHFGRQIYRKNDKSATNNSTKVAFAATWRCIEYEALIQQFVYAIIGHTEMAHVVIAWADFYKTMRDVAPTLGSIGTAFAE